MFVFDLIISFAYPTQILEYYESLRKKNHM